MPAHIDPTDLSRLGPAARAQIARALGEDPAPGVPAPAERAAPGGAGRRRPWFGARIWDWATEPADDDDPEPAPATRRRTVPWRTVGYVSAGVAAAGVVGLAVFGVAILWPHGRPPACLETTCVSVPAQAVASATEAPAAAPAPAPVPVSAPAPQAAPAAAAPAPAAPDLSAVIACVESGGYKPALATSVVEDPDKHGDLLDRCRADPSYRVPSPNAYDPHSPIQYTCFGDAANDGGDDCTLQPAAVAAALSSGVLTCGDPPEWWSPTEVCTFATGTAPPQTVSEPPPTASCTITWDFGWGGPCVYATIYACPAPLTGQIGGAGNRIALTIKVHGPDGNASQSVWLDTGAGNSILPSALLESLGFVPYGTESESGLVAGASETVQMFSLPGDDLTIADHGYQSPLATGTLTVLGAPSGIDDLLGPDLLQNGLRLSTQAGGQWTLVPPCGS